MERTPPSDAATGPTDAGTTPAAAEAAPLRRIQTVAHLMDDAFRVPGTDFRFGLDPILGILPGVGDTFSSLFSLYIVLEAARAGLPRSTLFKMLGVVGVDTVAGSVPLIGPVFDAAWKSNKWNVATLERHVEGASSDEDDRTRPGPTV